ncbi:MAG: outer membrane beta-barrel protein [Lewinellaceae bacterium]|nr:outer membrane beta-barrel protein [Lewinella sp.]MCB9280257.1 outer membrane beta-barrel protein [Lewinellaceae bacterium]
MKKMLLLATGMLLVIGAGAQSYGFGLKGGLTIGTQNWNSFERDPLLKYHGIAFIESYDPEDPFALFAQVGYHVKGSAIRRRNFYNPNTSTFFQPPAYQFLFNNLSLTLGAKQKFGFTGNSKTYYMIGVRGDYTLSTNLGEYESFNETNPGYSIFPFNDNNFIRRFNYGLTVGGGIEKPLGEYVDLILEFSVNPDFSLQYQQPAIPNVYVAYGTGTDRRTLEERRIRNITFELTVGFRFLHIIEFVD